MARDRGNAGAPPESVISIIGPGMTVVGDCTTDGTLRIEGCVEGSVRAGKAVVIGRDGVVDGSVVTQDAVIGGRVTGTVTAESRLEVQASARVDGEVRARRMQLDEGAVLNGRLTMGEEAGNEASGTEPSEAPVEFFDACRTPSVERAVEPRPVGLKPAFPQTSEPVDNPASPNLSTHGPRFPRPRRHGPSTRARPGGREP